MSILSAQAVDPELARLRESIDNFDAALIHLLAERFRCTQRVGELKARKGIPPSDPDREARQVARLRKLAVEAKLERRRGFGQQTGARQPVLWQARAAPLQPSMLPSPIHRTAPET